MASSETKDLAVDDSQSKEHPSSRQSSSNTDSDRGSIPEILPSEKQETEDREDREDREEREDDPVEFNLSPINMSLSSFQSEPRSPQQINIADALVPIPATPPVNNARKSYRKRRSRLRVCVIFQLLIDLASLVVPFVPSIVKPHTFHHVPLVLSPLIAQIYLHKPRRKIFIAALSAYAASAFYGTCLCVYGLISVGLNIGLGQYDEMQMISYIVSALGMLILDGAGVILVCGIRLHCIPAEAERGMIKHCETSSNNQLVCYRARPLEDIVESQAEKQSPVRVSELIEQMQKQAKKRSAPIIVDDCVAELTSSFDASQVVLSPNTDRLRELEMLLTSAAKASTQAFLNAPSLNSSAHTSSNRHSKSIEQSGECIKQVVQRRLEGESEARKHQPLRKGVIVMDEDIETGYSNCDAEGNTTAGVNINNDMDMDSPQSDLGLSICNSKMTELKPSNQPNTDAVNDGIIRSPMEPEQEPQII